jgi:hypothetical protein
MIGITIEINITIKSKFVCLLYVLSRQNNFYEKSNSSLILIQSQYFYYLSTTNYVFIKVFIQFQAFIKCIDIAINQHIMDYLLEIKNKVSMIINLLNKAKKYI